MPRKHFLTGSTHKPTRALIITGPGVRAQLSYLGREVMRSIAITPCAICADPVPVTATEIEAGSTPLCLPCEEGLTRREWEDRFYARLDAMCEAQKGGQGNV
jgi:hypothetical protein